MTKLLLTRIPFFREIIIMSFECPHCHFKDAEIQSAGEIQQKGVRSELRLTSLEDFSRSVVKSDTCIIKIVELDLEVPPGRGQLTNVEGILSSILDDLSLKQPERKEQIPEVYEKIEAVIAKGRKMLAGESFPFRISVDDPAGNSWIEPNPKDGVGKVARVEYPRTPEQNESLGLGLHPEEEPQRPTADLDDVEIIPNEVYTFPGACPGCARHSLTHMKMVDIPYFKQVILMSTVCDFCGYRSNEVKTGGAVPEKGRIITLRVENPVDLARDILKSEACALECPELQLHVNPGTLGGRFTTVEGLLTQVRDELHKQIFSLGEESEGGDSLESGTKRTWKEFFATMDEAIKGNMKFTIILRDPMASSYVQNLCTPDADPQIDSEEYERTKEEEDDLGLTDMKVEGYEDDTAKEKEAEKQVADEQVAGDKGADEKAAEDTAKLEAEESKS
ncbi:nucleolar zinc-finger protein [Clarireedia jacksonii]